MEGITVLLMIMLTCLLIFKVISLYSNWNYFTTMQIVHLMLHRGVGYPSSGSPGEEGSAYVNPLVLHMPLKISKFVCN